MPQARLPASFRDPAGFLFRDRDGTLLRQVNLRARDSFEQWIASGLYDELVQDKLVVEHVEVDHPGLIRNQAYRVLRPREIPFISYPYEWCFSALKDAALLTLEIQSRALAKGMTLKDASAFNVQFDGSRPIFIDSLSFERYVEGHPWSAYGQFCRHFLAPLALMAWVDINLSRMSSLYLDGVPLGLAARLLPHRTLATPGLLLHLHLHARMIDRHAASDAATRSRVGAAADLSPGALVRLVESLRATVERLRGSHRSSSWSDYYHSCTYSDAASTAKASLVESMLRSVQPKRVWDLGANTGRFSELAARQGAAVVAFDEDALCVDLLYRRCQASSARILPLRQDLANPSPSLGWRHRERDSLMARSGADLVLALALVHHLAIVNHVPLGSIAELLAGLGNYLVVEWIPKEDPQVRRLLAGREDVFDGYSASHFESAFGRHFQILRRDEIPQTHRVLYLMEGRP